jgi:methyl-accepting chemotaxis protein
MKKKLRIKSFGIRFKLILAFSLPVACIIILGIISYQRTTDAVKEQYRKSTMQTMGKAADYLNLLMLKVEDTALAISSDETLVSYYGKKSDESVDLTVVTKKLKSYLVADDYVKNGYFIAVNNDNISTNNSVTFDSKAYEDYKASLDYVEINGRGNKVWLGSSQFLSGKVYGGEPQAVLTLTRLVKDFASGETLGYLILEIRPEVIEDILTDLDFGKNSLVVLVGQDKNEIALQDKLTGKPGDFLISNTDTYNDILQNVEIEGFKKNIEFQGAKNLMCYTYIGNLGCVMVGLVPNATMLEQTNAIKMLTLLLVVIASLLAIGVGSYMAYGMSSNINKIIKCRPR